MLLQTVRRHAGFLVVLTLFIGGVLLQQAALPIMEGYDESLHFNYVRWIRAYGRAPDRATEASNTTRQESSQPPLYYWVAARLIDLFRLPPNTADYELNEVRNMWFTPPDEWRRRDNLNVYYHGPAEAFFGHPDIVAEDRAARVASLFFGLLAVIGAYGASREIFQDERWTLVATGIFAFTPQMLNMSAVVSNDVAAAAFASLTVWQAVSLLRRGATPLRLIATGLLLGLAGLSKVNALLVAPGVGAALLLDARQRRLSPVQFTINGVLTGAACLVIVGPWLLNGLVANGSLLGLEAHNIFAQPGQPTPGLAQLGLALVQVYASYLDRFGGGGVWMNPVIYVVLTVTVILALAGYLVTFRSLNLRSPRSGLMLVLLVVALANLGGILYWLLKLFAIASGIQGRLMYPGHLAYSLLLTGGLYLLARRLSARRAWLLRCYAIGTMLAIGLLIAPLDIFAAFATPTLLSRAQLPALQGIPIDFDHTIRLLGYTRASPQIRNGKLYTITLCWEVLAPAKSTAVMSVKILDGSELVGDRTTIPGLGHFNSTLWQPGDIYCEDVDVLPGQPLIPGHIYDVVVVILNWPATTPDGAAVPLPRIAQVVSPAGSDAVASGAGWQPAALAFPNFATLENFRLTGTPGADQSLKLELLWKVTGQTTASWSQFIHMVGPGTSGSLADKIPRDGFYPTWAWSNGEKFIDQWQFEIPASLAPGEYRIEVGFYRQDTGERMPVTLNGVPAQDNSATLLSFQVP